jgi:hypothetical protein
MRKALVAPGRVGGVGAGQPDVSFATTRADRSAGLGSARTSRRGASPKPVDRIGVPQEHASTIAVLKTENDAATARKAAAIRRYLVLRKAGGDPE